MAVAVSTVVFDGYDYDQGLALLAGCGVEEVEPAFIAGYVPFSETTFSERGGTDLRGKLAAHGLAARAVSAHLDLGAATSADGLVRRLDFALALGADILVTNATTTDRADAFAEAIGSALPAFERTGATLALENPGHGTDALLPSGRAAAGFLAWYDHPRLRLNYDVCNALTYSGARIDLAADLAAALPWACRLHLKDIAAVGEDWHFCALGRGQVAYRQLFPMRAPGTVPPVAIEHPVRLWRPGRGDPARMEDVPDRSDLMEAVRLSLRTAEALGFR